MTRAKKKWIAIATAAIAVVQVGCTGKTPDTLSVEAGIPDPSGLGKIFLEEVHAVGKGTTKRIDMDAQILVLEALSNDINDLASGRIHEAFNGASIIEIQNGVVAWNDKPLPAAIVKVELSKINRDAGSYEKFCLAFCAVRDEEFARIRNPLYSNCETDKIEAWKNRTGFKAK